jgi:SNF2 family DNA or RNA helicase
LAPSTQQLNAYKKLLEKCGVVADARAAKKLGMDVLSAISILKRLCNHPSLLLPFGPSSPWVDYIDQVSGEKRSVGSHKVRKSTDATGDPWADAIDIVEPSDRKDFLESDETVERLLDPNFEDNLGATSLEALEALGVADVKALQTMSSADDILSYSSKLQFLKELLPSLASRGHRTLIFCQSVKMLDLVQLCCLKPAGLRCLRIDGLTNIRDRAEKVEKFNRQPERFQCMLLTTTTGGVGLNLTGADRVVLVDPAWNPAVDAQAVDRAFRIGQTREVKVYRLIMSGLVEDKMFRLQIFKMGLTKTALDADQMHSIFTQQEIRKLFEFTEPSECQTKEMLLRMHPDGDEGAARSAMEDGGSQDGWLAAKPSLGLSNFAQLYSGLVKDEEHDLEATARQAEKALETLLAEQYDAEHYMHDKALKDDMSEDEADI